jgi:phosphatidylglycerophosphate synthase
MHAGSAPLPTLALWSRVHALAMLFAAAISLALAGTWPAAAIGAASLGACVALHRGRWTPSGAFGAANALTLLRLGLSMLLVALCVRPPGPAAALLVLGIFALDGLDGLLARRSGQASTFGACFDMECDALLVLLCALLLWQHERLPAWVLVPGLLRYLYVAMLMLLPAGGGGEAPRSLIGRLAFSALILGFAASLWPLDPLHRVLTPLASLLVGYSFARSMYWSFKAR